MIAIQSNRKLQFPPASVGFVRMEIDLIQNKPKEEVYDLRIIDTCFEIATERRLKQSYVQQENVEPTEDDYEDVEIEVVLGKNTRFKTYSYDQLRQMSQAIPNSNADNEIDRINELFSNGLLLITQMECSQNISGEGKGMYFSEATDWE
jgi:hypothetical protein